MHLDNLIECLLFTEHFLCPLPDLILARGLTPWACCSWDQAWRAEGSNLPILGWVRALAGILITKNSSTRHGKCGLLAAAWQNPPCLPDKTSVYLSRVGNYWRAVWVQKCKPRTLTYFWWCKSRKQMGTLSGWRGGFCFWLCFQWSRNRLFPSSGTQKSARRLRERLGETIGTVWGGRWANGCF